MWYCSVCILCILKLCNVINKVFTIMINLYVMSIGSNLFLIVSFPPWNSCRKIHLLFYIFSASAENFPVRVSGNKNMCKWAINHFPNGVVTNLERFMHTRITKVFFITPMSLSSQTFVQSELLFIKYTFFAFTNAYNAYKLI